MMLLYTHQEILLKPIAASINVLSKYLKNEHEDPSNGSCDQFKYDQLAQILTVTGQLGPVVFL